MVPDGQRHSANALLRTDKTLVLPTRSRGDGADSAALLLESLRIRDSGLADSGLAGKSKWHPSFSVGSDGNRGGERYTR